MSHDAKLHEVAMRSRILTALVVSTSFLASGCSVYDPSLYLAADQQESEDAGNASGSGSGGTTSAGSTSGIPTSGDSTQGGTTGVEDDGTTGGTDDDDTGTTGDVTDGPMVELLNPEELRVFPSTGATQPISLRVTNLTLAPPGRNNEPGVAHVEVRLDGELVATLTDGGGGSITQTEPIEFPTAGGIHRIEAIALQNDGTAYEGVVAHAPFWVDDGREHIAWVRPAPNTEVPIGAENVEMELATLNFVLVAAAAAEDPFAFGEGHAHLLLGRGLPGCLPDCAFLWEQMVEPLDDDRVYRMSFVSENPLTPTTLGVHELEVLANDNSHDVYYRETAPEEPVFDAIPLVFVAP